MHARQAINDNAKLDAQVPNSLLSHSKTLDSLNGYAK
jgi:hypothetical protein